MKPIIVKKDKITKEDLIDAFPEKKGTITDELVEIFNKASEEPEFQGESLFQAAITYDKVLKSAHVSITEYVNALRFCAYLITNEDNYTKAYIRTFWNREFVQKRKDAPTGSNEYKALVAAASRYRRSKLVVDVLTVSQAPLDLLFAGERYKALSVLANLMETAKLDRDKINAAKELLAATKNENSKIELEIGPTAEAADMQKQLNMQLAEIAANQKRMLEAGYDIDEVQKVSVQVNESKVIDGEVLDEIPQ